MVTRARNLARMFQRLADVDSFDGLFIREWDAELPSCFGREANEGAFNLLRYNIEGHASLRAGRFLVSCRQEANEQARGRAEPFLEDGAPTPSLNDLA